MSKFYVKLVVISILLQNCSNVTVVLVKYLPTIDILPIEDASILINIHIIYWRLC